MVSAVYIRNLNKAMQFTQTADSLSAEILEKPKLVFNVNFGKE